MKGKIIKGFLEPNLCLSVKFLINSSMSGNRGAYFQSLLSVGRICVSHAKRSDFLNFQNKDLL